MDTAPEYFMALGGGALRLQLLAVERSYIREPEPVVSVRVAVVHVENERANIRAVVEAAGYESDAR